MWREWLKEWGIKMVALELGLVYETVRCWHSGIRLPEGANLKALVRLARCRLSDDEFLAFCDSLAADLLGVSRKAAVNE